MARLGTSPVAYAAVGLAAALTACQPETTFTTLSPEISVLPEALAFGPVVAAQGGATGDIGTISVKVDNGGRATLTGSIRIEGTNPEPFGFDAAATELDLPAGESTTFDVHFAPTELGDFAAALVFDTNDPDDEGLLAVEMTGTGRVPYAPDIEIRPAEGLDFGAVGPLNDTLGFFDIANVGDADLLLGSIFQSGAGVFSMDYDYSGTVVAPGQKKSVVMHYVPVQTDGDSGAVHVLSNDADEPEVVVPLEGNGGGTAQYPEAVFDCPGTVDLTGAVTVPLDGSGSTDPNDLPLTYAWSIVRRPAAADVNRTPVPTDAAATTVLVDTAGTWEVALQVTNSAGVPSVPTKCVLDAVPIDALHVELSWSGPTSDLDLHLAEADAAFFSVPGDTSWCNRNPDWGMAGDTDDDDPLLDPDDDDGFGPEHINVFRPAAGVYPVRVHLFEDGQDDAVTATVSVFANGALIHTSNQVLNRNEVWEVGQVNWPEGTFGVSDAPLWDAEGTRECQ